MEQHFKSKYVYIVVGLACILSCTSEKKQSRIISKDILFGEWTLVGGEKQINYPAIEFLKDGSAVLYSQADTLYRFTFSIRNDSLFLADINGKKYANRIKELNDKTLVLDGIADVKEDQLFER